MSAALRSRVPKRQQPARRSTSHNRESKIAHFAPPSRSRHRKQSANPSRQAALPPAGHRQAVPLPKPRPYPLWLMRLVSAQRSSSVVAVCLIAAVLVVYGWTVYSQQLWGRQYQKLEALQKQERQLTAANEALKNQMAQQAESSEAGLVLPRPSDTIFLAPVPPRPPVAPSPEAITSPSSATRALGY